MPINQQLTILDNCLMAIIFACFLIARSRLNCSLCSLVHAFDSQGKKARVMKEKRRLRSRNSRVFINHDWTREQREQFKRLRAMRKQANMMAMRQLSRMVNCWLTGRGLIPTLHVRILLQNRMYAGVATVFLFVFGIFMVFQLVDLRNYFTKFDFVCLSETWLKDEISFVIDLPGYVHFSFCRHNTNHRAKRGAGGMLLHIKKELQHGVRVLPPGKEQDRVWFVLDKAAFGQERDMHVCWFFLYSTLDFK